MNKPVASALGALAIFGVIGCGAAIAQKSGPDSAPAAPVADLFPAWAYPWAPDFKAPPDDGRATHVPDSTAIFTVTQERDLFFAPDWHPGDHAPMPDIVARGRRPDVRACGSFHRAEGTGGPENASLAGLSAAYIAQQMADFKSGARKFAGPQQGPVLTMIAIAKAATDAEVRAAAAYFSALKPKPIIKVVETDTVPVTQIARFFYTTVANGGTEPIGRRIVEVPVDVEQFEHRDFAFAVHGLCSDRKHCPGRSAGENRWIGHNDPLRRMPRPGPQRDRRHSQNRRTLAELHRPADI